MAIWVSSLALAPSMVRTRRPGRVVSLLSPHDPFPTFAGFDPARHLKVSIHDIDEDAGAWTAPRMQDAERILAFLQDWDRTEPLLVHCWAGISRSTAAAFIAACVHAPDADEEEIAWAIRDASPTAKPNARLVAHADALLGRAGRMSAAVAAIGLGEYAEEAMPFMLPATILALKAPGDP